MPHAIATCCTRSGCPGVVRAGRCSVCGPRATAAERGYDAAWQRLQAEVLQREKACRDCGGEAELMHHVASVREAPSRRLDRQNLVPLCRRCHGKRHGG